MTGDHEEMKHDIRSLTARQTEMELHDMSVAEKLLKDCGKSKWEVDEQEVNLLCFALL